MRQFGKETCGGCRFGIKTADPGLVCIGAPPVPVPIAAAPAQKIQLTGASSYQAPAQLQMRSVLPHGIDPRNPACALWHCRFCGAGLFEDCQNIRSAAGVVCPHLPAEVAQ